VFSNKIQKLITAFCADEVLIIQGLEDLIVPPANGLLLASNIEGAWLVQIPHVGHGAVSEDPVRVAALVDAFLLPTT
jgi:pimeloyl-ACP methyl ester carboxylesterase